VIADVASGDRGVWKRLVPGIKVPRATGTQGLQFAYLYALGDYDDYGADSASNLGRVPYWRSG
jgi:hypothetical protein